ncbi:Crp/Fnr family transcriptional regulator [Candidatus Marinarcus aquaticus]|uniref:Crp/Fnr family transcriptional regulator n=1 Tax=Candidatus Marinarcus aquaticus TaxID=2044504 RepID=A0A4Q0XSC0_9BACT|nr:Crp/Fnr family transcriptional regulator [Candidatus Marinarcus aquaticus]RXJ57606.1 Crp/Fnr family transcriptional regulator [Candidatus Marinarcus aquaticus]
MTGYLKEFFLFEDLCDETLSEIEKFTRKVSYPKESIVFYEGDDSKELFLLQSGIIKLYKVTSNDKEIILKYFHSNELIAEVANFENMPYPATAQAFTDVEVIKIDFASLKDVIYDNPSLAFKIQGSLIKKIKNLENLVSLHVVLDSQERLAKYIHDRTEEFFSTKNVSTAEILNISPETLSRILRTFKDEGIVDMGKQTVNKERLKQFFM